MNSWIALSVRTPDGAVITIPAKKDWARRVAMRNIKSGCIVLNYSVVLPSGETLFTNTNLDEL